MGNPHRKNEEYQRHTRSPKRFKISKIMTNHTKTTFIKILFFSCLVLFCYPQTHVWANGIFLPEFVQGTFPLAANFQEVSKAAKEKIASNRCVDNYQQQATDRYATQLGGGASPNEAYVNVMLMSVVGPTGATDFVQGVSGIDLTNGQYLSGADRLSQTLGGAGQLILTGIGVGGAVERATQGIMTPTLQEGSTVYRVFGGDAKAFGSSWTTVNPAAVSDFRAAAGLPVGNTGRFVIEGRITSLEGVTLRPALPGPTTPSGSLQVPEVLFRPGTVKSQIRASRVSGVNPEY